MGSLKTIWGSLCLGGVALPAALLLAARAAAADFSLESAGGRFGFPANESARHFNQAEAFVNWNLPWHWTLDHDWHLQTRLDFSAGWLGDSRYDAAIGTIGPTLVLGWKRFPVSLEGGVSPTLMTRDNFERKDFGIPFQFTTHIGVNLNLFKHLGLTYRFQHMSNAGLDGHNGGLNLHMFGVCYRF